MSTIKNLTSSFFRHLRAQLGVDDMAEAIVAGFRDGIRGEHDRSAQQASEFLKRMTPRPYVSVLVMGFENDGTAEGTARCLGTAKELADNFEQLQVRTQIPLRNVQVIVFADLRQVAVTNICCGVDLVTAGMGECPYARFLRFDVGTILSVNVEVRKRLGWS